jgi:hypothetical protein
MTPQELQNVLDLHRKWLLDEAGGTIANLDGASLDGASLDGASLDGANLARAYLARASLDGASLTGANLARAYLAGASLDGASLDGASLARAYLAGASLDGASLDGANLTGANLARAKGLPSREDAIALLDEIREVVVADQDKLHMQTWHEDGSRPHDCGTTHCLAGWAQALRKLDSPKAGVRAIWPASHMVYASDADALEFMRERRYATTP